MRLADATFRAAGHRLMRQLGIHPEDAKRTHERENQSDHALGEQLDNRLHASLSRAGKGMNKSTFRLDFGEIWTCFPIELLTR
jgi:hypothetical protein